MLSVTQTADILGVSTSRVRALIASGALPARKIGKSWAIEEEDAIRRVQGKPKAGRPAKATKGESRANTQVESPSAAFSDFYQLAKTQFSRYPSVDELDNFASREERSFAIAVADFFLQQRQRELIEQGVF